MGKLKRLNKQKVVYNDNYVELHRVVNIHIIHCADMTWQILEDQQLKVRRYVAF